MSLRSVFDGPVHVIANIMLFAQLGDLNVRVHFGDVALIPCYWSSEHPLLTNFPSQFSHLERRTVLIRSHPEYKPALDALGV